MGSSKLSIHVTCLMPVIYRNDLPGEERGLISFYLRAEWQRGAC